MGTHIPWYIFRIFVTRMPKRNQRKFRLNRGVLCLCLGVLATLSILLPYLYKKTLKKKRHFSAMWNVWSIQYHRKKNSRKFRANQSGVRSSCARTSFTRARANRNFTSYCHIRQPCRFSEPFNLGPENFFQKNFWKKKKIRSAVKSGNFFSPKS